MEPVEVLQKAMIIAKKDLRVEFRSREIFSTMLFFSVMVVLLFSFSFLKSSSKDSEMIAMGEMVPGIIWITLLFAGTLGLGRTFERERETGTMRALLLSPAPRISLFLGKTIGVFVVLALVALFVVPLIGLFFDNGFLSNMPELCVSLLMGILGFSIVGTFFAAMLLQSRARDVLLPVVLFPILIPLFIGGIKSTTGAATGDTMEAWFWIRFMLTYNVVFLTAAFWSFESLVIE